MEASSDRKHLKGPSPMQYSAELTSCGLPPTGARSNSSASSDASSPQPAPEFGKAAPTTFSAAAAVSGLEWTVFFTSASWEAPDAKPSPPIGNPGDGWRFGKRPRCTKAGATGHWSWRPAPIRGHSPWPPAGHLRSKAQVNKELTVSTECLKKYFSLAINKSNTETDFW